MENILKHCITVNIHLYPSDFQSESRILREVRALADAEIFDKFVLIGARVTNLPDFESIDTKIELHRVGPRKDLCKTPLARIFWVVAWNISAVFFCIRNQISCLNAHSLSVLPVAVFIKLIKYCNLVYDAHELETETAYSKGFRKRVGKLVERALIHLCDRHIFVSLAIAEWYEARYGITKSVVIYNVPDHAAPARKFSQHSMRQDLGIPKTQSIVLYQGLLSKGRGIDEVLAVARKLKACAFVFVGYGPLECAIKDASSALDNVYFHPRVPPQELLRMTAQADFGLSLIEPISLSYEYCMPNKLFEYIVADVPVIVSPTLEQKRLVTEFGAGVVAANLTSQGVLEAVCEALTADRAKLVEGCRKAAVQYEWTKQLERLYSVYEGMTS